MKLSSVAILRGWTAQTGLLHISSKPKGVVMKFFQRLCRTLELNDVKNDVERRNLQFIIPKLISHTQFHCNELHKQ